MALIEGTGMDVASQLLLSDGARFGSVPNASVNGYL